MKTAVRWINFMVARALARTLKEALFVNGEPVCALFLWLGSGAEWAVCDVGYVMV